LLIVVVVSLLLYSPLRLIDWTQILPLLLALYGVWLLALGGIRASSPQKYELGPFTTSAWGLLLIAIGGAWFAYAYNAVYSLAIILIVVGILAIIAALKRK
jgi:hypothetical protein